MPRLLAILVLCATAAAAKPTVFTRPSASPLISFRILVHSGSASDPAGKPGAAGLTAAMLTQGGTAETPYEDIVSALFPMAAGVSAQVDKEMIVIVGNTHVENLEAYYALLRDMILNPGWRKDDLSRLRDRQLTALRNDLRGNNEEELGKEALYQRIYPAGHPYHHHELGSAASIESLTLEDLQAFYKAHFTQANITIGLAGGYPDGFARRVAKDFGKLPKGKPHKLELPAPAQADKLDVRILKKTSPSVAISFGYPLPVRRGDKDWVALKLVQSYLGQHRSSKSHLYQRIRELRGMNYGDYVYIEHFPRGMFLTRPEPNLGRQQQVFQVWIRPVEPADAVFALRIALFELDKLVDNGISEANFEQTRTFLSKYAAVLAQTQSEQLGYALDSNYYGIGDFSKYLRDGLAALTHDDVNAAIRKYLRTEDLHVVMIAEDAEGLAEQLRSGAPSPKKYVSPPPEGILEEDKTVSKYKLDVGEVEIVPADTLFESDMPVEAKERGDRRRVPALL